MSLPKPCNRIKGGFQMHHVPLPVSSESLKSKYTVYKEKSRNTTIIRLYKSALCTGFFWDSTHTHIFQVSPSLSPTFATASSESKRIRPSGATSLKKPRAVVLKGHLNRFQVLLGCYLLGHGSKETPEVGPQVLGTMKSESLLQAVIGAEEIW